MRALLFVAAIALCILPGIVLGAMLGVPAVGILVVVLALIGLVMIVSGA